MGHKFSLVLSREITDGESATLREAGCVSAIFTTDSLPTDAAVTVTKMDVDDTTSPSLAEAIESALETVLTLPDLRVPGLTVPAQPAEPPAEAPDAVIDGEVVKKKPRTRKRNAGKTSAEKAASDEAAPVPVG